MAAFTGSAAAIAGPVVGMLSPKPGVMPPTATVPKTPLEIQAEGYGIAAERGPVPVPAATERTPLPSSYVDLTDAKAGTHILEGDATGGGHRPGTGIPGKSEFPQGWSDEKILDAVSDVATDPNVIWSKPDKRGYITGIKTIDGVDVKVVFDTKNGRIVTGYPTNLPRNP